MYKKLFLTLLALGFIGVLFFSGCTTAETPTYTDVLEVPGSAEVCLEFNTLS